MSSSVKVHMMAATVVLMVSEQKRVLVSQAPATFPVDVPMSRYRPSSRAVWENEFQIGV